MSVLSLIPEEKKKCNQSSESVYSSTSLKFPCALHKRKILHPLLSSTTMLSMANNSNRSGDKFVTKRVLSAKEHRVKQLQNQLADAHFHLSELSNENRLLRSLQKRQDSALQRYESANGDIPKMINSHTEEIRSFQVRYKQLKIQLREVNQKLKDKDFELQQLSDDHKHLLSLSKDNNLIEREKLQIQVAELTEKIQKQNDMISTLQRRISLESKNHKHQLRAEMLKHRETQQQLNEAISHSDQLTSAMEMKEKMISASMSKKIFPKINVGSTSSKGSLHMFSLDTRSKQSLLPTQLSTKGNSSSDSQTSLESIKSSSRSKSPFSVIGRAVQSHESSENNLLMKTENDKSVKKKYTNIDNDLSDTSNAFDNTSSGYDIVKAIREGMPNMKIFESDTEAPKSSDDEVRHRVEFMKQQLRKESLDSIISFERHEKNVTYREGKKHSEEDISSTSEDSQSEVGSSHPDTQVNTNRTSKDSIKQLQSKRINEEYSNSSKNELDLKSIDLYKQSLSEIDGKKGLQNNINEQLLLHANDSNNEVPSDDINNTKKKDSIIDEYLRENPKTEMNNNSLTARKVSSELNGEKKKKLLAALKAIDRGEDDGMYFDANKSSKGRAKSLYGNTTKNI